MADVTLTESERADLIRARPWPEEAATTKGGFNDVVSATEAIVAARVAAALGEVEARITALRSAGNSNEAAWMLIDAVTIVREVRGEVGG